MLHVLFFFMIFLLMGNLAQAASVRLAWTTAPGDPQGYIMERKFGLSGTYTPVGYPKEAVWEDVDIPSTQGKSICYQVRAFNELGTAEPSNELCLRLPGAPANFRLETFGPSATEPRVSVRVKVRKK